MITASPVSYGILGLLILVCLIVECITLRQLWKDRKK